MSTTIRKTISIRKPRPGSSISIGNGIDSGLDGASPPGSPTPRCPSPLVKEKVEVQVKVVVARGGVSPAVALIVVILASLGGFFAGRTANRAPFFSGRQQQQQPRDREEGRIPFAAELRRAEFPRTDRRRPPSSTRSSPSELERRRRLAAHAIHPVLLTVLPAPASIALAVDWHRRRNPDSDPRQREQNALLAGDLLSEILVYESARRITVFLVDETDDDGDYPTDSSECPRMLTGILASTGRRDIEMECCYVNGNVDGLSSRHHFNVAVVLAGCGSNGPHHGGSTTWEDYLYAATDSVAVKCVGRTYPLGHPTRQRSSDNNNSDNNNNNNIDRIERFFVSTDSFVHVTDYDVFGARGISTNFAVAFRSVPDGSDQWRLAEADYQVAMHRRWRRRPSSVVGTTLDDDDDGVSFVFDAADMVHVQYPSRQSAASSCERHRHLIQDPDDDWEMFCEVGLDPHIPNLPADRFYVAKSTAGDNVGRGVFSNVDVTEGVYLMAEKTVHDVVFSFRGFAILEDVLEGFCLPRAATETSDSDRRTTRLDSLRCMPGIYYDSYGFGRVPHGLPVNSGISTFTNHGCNGTHNIEITFGENSTEFTLLPDDGTVPDPNSFAVPDDFWFGTLYNPNRERNGRLMRYDNAEGDVRPIPAHTELLDNYAAFDGHKYFLVQVVKLKEQCLGASGTVTAYEDEREGGGAATSRGRSMDEHRYEIFGSPLVMDADGVILRRLARKRDEARLVGAAATDGSS